ncbi:MAG TPA: Rpn family recombination-promoting nuclease/putative transposase [Polyangiaceae bacterium]
MTTSPHDALFKAAFGQPDLAREELELVLPADIRAHLDLGTLSLCAGSFVDEDLQHTHSDLLFTVRMKGGGEGLVYVLLEHQSSSDGTMAFRCLRYVVRVWERWLRDHPGAKTLPIVLPVVLHHGEGAWRGIPELAAMIEAPAELLAAARPFVPHFRFLLDDLAKLSPATLASRSLGALPRLVQLALWASRSFPRLRDAAPFMRAAMGTLVRDERTRALLMQLFVYVLDTAPPDVEAGAIRSILLEIAGPQGREDVVNAGDQLRSEGEAKSLREAIVEFLGERNVSLSEVGRARLASCADLTILKVWLKRSVTAAAEADVFAGQ